MAIVTLRQQWQDIIADAGRRPNTKFVFTDGIVAGFVLNNNVFEGFFEWPAVGPNASSDFILFETIVTAAGLQDLLSIEKEGQSKLPRRVGAKIIMETLRGESVPAARFFAQVPLNTIQAVHPNNNIGRARVQLDQIFGWDYLGFESEYINPTEASRLIISQNLRVEFGFRNPNPFPVTNISRIIFNILEWQPLDPQRAVDVDRLVGIVKGKIPSISWTPGVARSDLTTFTEDFNVPAVDLVDGQVVFEGRVLG